MQNSTLLTSLKRIDRKFYVYGLVKRSSFLVHQKCVFNACSPSDDYMNGVRNTWS